MKMLDLENNLNFDDPPQIYGTALNRDKEGINEIVKQYFNFNKKIPNPIIESINCKELIKKYF